MGKVIFEKNNGKKVSIPWFIFDNIRKIRGLYSVKEIDSSFISITFEECKFNSNFNFILEDYQSLSIIDCEFGHKASYLIISGGKNIKTSNIKTLNFFELVIYGCDNLSLNLSNHVRNLDVKKVNNMSINGKLSTNGLVNIRANNLNIDNSVIEADYLSLENKYLNINNSYFTYADGCDIEYSSLAMNDVYFNSKRGRLDFISVSDEESVTENTVISYKAPVSLTDKDIFNEKNQAIYSLLSILKGYRNQVDYKNEIDINNAISPINSELSMKLDELEKEKNRLISEFVSDKEEIKKNLSNRKIKTLSFQKK